jgi:cobalt-zinc-cadmium efflux system outer membrane protein
MLRQWLLIAGVFLASGCAFPVQQRINQVVAEIADHPYDSAPESAASRPKSRVAPTANDGTTSSDRANQKAVPDVPTDVEAVAWMGSQSGRKRRHSDRANDGVEMAALTESQSEPSIPKGTPRKLDLEIPPQFPGSEALRIDLPKDQASLEPEINRIYPELPSLPVEPDVQPGPSGKPYTLSDLQRLAAANSPTLRQAVSDVEAAEGNLVQAKTYQNPTIGYLFDPANNNSTANTQGVFIDQPIRTAGKQKLSVAAAQVDLENSQLALKRARSDLATAVRNAYFALLVDVETLYVTRSVAQFTDDIYRMQTGLLKGAVAAPYEPASLRAQAFTTRLAYKQAIASYIYDWKMLAATIGERQLPLSEIAGEVDRQIPYYDYDQVLAYALNHHTDMLTAQNSVRKAQYGLKLSQVTPIPDIDVRASLERDKSLAPFGTYGAFMIGVPVAIWDQNRGNILASQAGLARAGEESHRVEVTLTNGLATAYANYQNNLYAIEYYRRHILPDLVRYYRGIYARRQIDPTSPFGDLVAAQQTLSSNVASYLGVLQSLWTSVVAVADYLQTDDLFQMARPRELPEFPDLDQRPNLP